MKKLTAQQQIIEDFAKTWKERTGHEYFINWPKEVKACNILIAMNMAPDDYVERKNFFFSDRKWWEFGKWDFAVFVKHINKLIPEARGPRNGSALESQQITCQLHGIKHGLMQQCPECYKESLAIMERERNSHE
jgi:hypothetical protein